MSVQAMSWALSQQIVTEAHGRHVLLCLANYADQDGRAAFPSISSLARDTGLSPRTVQYRIRDLENLGVIKRGNQAIPAAYINQRDRIPVCYDIDLQRGAQHAPGAHEDAPGCTPEQSGVHATTVRGAQHAPNPPINHPLTIHNHKEGDTALGQGEQTGKSIRKSTKFEPASMKPANASERAWTDFCDMRKTKRAPLTLRACEMIAAKLANHADPDAVLDKSTASSWSDVSPESVLPGTSAKNGKPSRHTDLDQVDHTEGLELDANGNFRIAGGGQ
ncbi:helix-turn-helix domain-containing protein [Pseudomonas tremae]|uniref:helix-turn-helix domain-containing protein n=1 Tax=Pseudomonas tremae TaxID=200454 RepID=UPI001F36C6DC|nr:helix-turn-helix domain-containing protein [Pseudomonas tremae]MCF5712481.1 winged helix-turn-helix transcriptional regulator [Pseudomonas tremae]UQB32537.1 helix-turn-helix domain-containing protein [Pseudomonas tremae]